MAVASAKTPVRYRQEGPVAGCGGFSLLELLVSILLIVLVVSIAGLALRLGYRSVEAGERKIDAMERFRSSMLIVVSQLESQIPLIFEEDAEKTASFRGDGKSVQFATNASIWDGRRGYVTVRYSVEPDKDGKCLLTATESAIGIEGARTTRLFEALDDMSFEYFHQDITEPGKWVSSWPADEMDDLQFPDRMRMNIVHDAGKYALVIPMRSGASDMKDRNVVQGLSATK